jgi:hypothetical protein
MLNGAIAARRAATKQRLVSGLKKLKTLNV